MLFNRSRMVFAPEGVEGAPAGDGVISSTVTPEAARTFLADFAHDPEAVKAMPDPDVLKWHERVNGTVTKIKGSAQPGDWRTQLKTDAAKKLAETSPDLDHFANRALTMQQKLSGAILKPGKDAKPEEIAAFRKAMDVPDEPKGYLEGIAKPDFIADEEWKGERVQGILGKFAERMHAKGVSREAVKEAISFELEMEASQLQAAKEADANFLKEAEAQLRKDWPGSEYEVNSTLAKRAFAHMAKQAGLEADELLKIETKEGRFLMDDPRMVRAYATLGREMGEGTLGSVITDSDRGKLEDQVRTLRSQQSEAQAKGENQRANQLYQEEQALIARMNGAKSVVGANGRTA